MRRRRGSCGTLAPGLDAECNDHVAPWATSLSPADFHPPKPCVNSWQISAERFITQSVWGRHLPVDDLRRVIESAREIRVSTGNYLVHAGDTADHWVGLMDGLVVQRVMNADGKPAVLTATCAPNWFGEGTLLKKVRWQYDAIARRETRAVLVPVKTFTWLSDNSLAFNQFLVRMVNARLGHYMGLLANERLSTTDQKVANVLASLFDPDLYPDRPPLLRINQTDLALMSGMSRQRVNVALQRLRDKGLVDITRSSLHILDVEAIRRYHGDMDDPAAA